MTILRKGRCASMNDEYQALCDWLYATRDEPLEHMASFFGARIADYEQHMSPWLEHYDWMARLVPENACNLLDIGCGTGLELDSIFSRLPELRVTGVDLSGEMLSRLAAKHAGRALTLIQADYFECELGTERFDVAISFETLHHFTLARKIGLFRRIFNCLKPGGVYLECDYIAQTQEIEDLLFDECARRRARDGISPDVYVHFDTPLTLDHELLVMREGGFSCVEVVGYIPGDRNTPMLKAIK